MLKYYLQLIFQTPSINIWAFKPLEYFEGMDYKESELKVNSEKIQHVKWLLSAFTAVHWISWLNKAMLSQMKCTVERQCQNDEGMSGSSQNRI